MNEARSIGSEPVCRRALFVGRVQGVGFRYTAASIAKGYPVRGYVKNLPDGSVELVAEGEQKQVERLLARIDEEFAGNIRHRTVDDLPLGQAFAGFEIRH